MRSFFCLIGYMFTLGIAILAGGCGDDSAGTTGSTEPTDDTSANNNTQPEFVELNGKYVPDDSAAPAAQQSGFLHAEGNQLYTDSGSPARLTGVNWFGFETGNLSPHGLWSRDYRSVLHQIADMGFNTVRIPWCNAMLTDDAHTVSINTDGVDPYDGTSPMNVGLDEKTPLELLDIIIDAASEAGLKVILDNHSRRPDGYMEEKLWYTDDVSETKWVEDWRLLAARYYGNATVVAVDLNNEPHGNATWGTAMEGTDWHGAAERCGNAILQVNPDVLIIVEGVEQVGLDSYWWGGNLMGVTANPIELSHPDKLVYSAHEYGPEVFVQPWFQTTTFPENMTDIWNKHFGFVVRDAISPLFIGEFGIRDRESANGISGTWFDSFLSYMGNTYSWTFWCLNPNSGDTQGILQDDWVTPHQWKLDTLSPYLAPMLE
ncbi:MAG: glycoside hydrolase family 5 protein [Deltaproteobacteria bacterium]|nr:glycoside hydrolase family 5 protein [Deltaproteobacteria bacterium]